LTFLGASYYRARTASGAYGASARGLAIDVGLNKPEEFPVFRGFWVEKPVKGATTVCILALMDTPSAVGAYQFRFEPGVDQSTLDVDATLVFRNAVERVGIAPLTSMWMWGDGLDGPVEDSRPEVHDSDALVFCSRTEDQQERWTCRSLMRQNYPSIVQFPQTNLVGFGLAQRDIQADHYNDNEAKYHLRPSIWVEPTTDWGHGAIQLLELPAEHEGIDNMAVWWSPDTAIQPMVPFSLSYRVTFASGDVSAHSLLKLVAHRVQRPVESKQEFEIGLDFASSHLTPEIHEPSTVEVVCSGVRCEIERSNAVQNSDGSWTIAMVVRPTTDADPFELMVQLVQNSRPISETWSYLCPIQSPPAMLPPWRQKP
jgi:periplasmic glucans biosynthesis protein